MCMSNERKAIHDLVAGCTQVSFMYKMISSIDGSLSPIQNAKMKIWYIFNRTLIWTRLQRLYARHCNVSSDGCNNMKPSQVAEKQQHILIIIVLIASNCIRFSGMLCWEGCWRTMVRPHQNSPKRSLPPLGIVIYHLWFWSTQHFPHHLNILIFTSLYIITKLQNPSTVFASFNTRRNSNPDSSNRKDHLVPQLHESLFHFCFPLHFLLFLVIIATVTITIIIVFVCTAYNSNTRQCRRRRRSVCSKGFQRKIKQRNDFDLSIDIILIFLFSWKNFVFEFVALKKLL